MKLLQNFTQKGKSLKISVTNLDKSNADTHSTNNNEVILEEFFKSIETTLENYQKNDY